MKSPDVDAKPNVKPALLGCGCLVSPIVLIFLLFFGTTFYNNFRLWRFERNFAAISHPPASKFVARTSEIGLFGNGNHCDFLVAEVRSFAGSRSSVHNFYKTMRVVVPNRADNDFSDVKNGTQPVEILFLPSPLPANYEWEFSFAQPIDLSKARGQKNLYIVMICNSGENNSWDSVCDMRCG